MNPKFKRNLGRILPFGVIWLVISCFSIINDLSLTRNQNFNPDTDVTLTIPVIIIASLASFLVGLLVGFLEMVFLAYRFRKFSFTRALVYKLTLYLLLMTVVVALIYPIVASIESGNSIFSQEVLQKTARFFNSITFLNTMIQLGFSLLVSMIYTGISEHLGYNFLRNLVLGKYHHPQEENRIFMFLDMNESTAIAERLGHIRYFDLLQAYYEIMSDPIIQHQGEVYQYIGDEVVITWEAAEGLKSNHAVACFFRIEENLRRHASKFESEFGVVPYFKAGIHLGEVTAGELGALKKEIVFTGDVLNTAARIQSMCKTYRQTLIISREVKDGLEAPDQIKMESLGEVVLRGREESGALYGVRGLVP